jgi:hypothetical protein
MAEEVGFKACQPVRPRTVTGRDHLRSTHSSIILASLDLPRFPSREKALGSPPPWQCNDAVH